MIGRIRGKILEKSPPLIVIDIHGLGYEVFAPMTTFYHLPDIGAEVNLLTHQVVREDAHILYGFISAAERELFRILIKVSGIGPKLAITILSGIEPEQFIACVQQEDADRLTIIPGIGKKTAERLIIETRDAINKLEITEHPGISLNNESSANRNFIDAISALTALGYKPHEAKRAINAVHAPEHSSETLIRLALKTMLQGAN